MKAQLSALTLLVGAALVAPESQAYSQITHKRIVEDAVKYMAANPSTTQYAKLAQVANAAGISVTELGSRLGQGAYDVDDFEDTFFCGAVTGDCVQAPLWGTAKSIVKYTSYWHFQNHTRGADEHGNDLGGYNIAKLTVKGTVDNLAKTWLIGDYLDDGKGGETGWFWADDTKYNTYGVTEKNYRVGSYSRYSMYDDFEHMPFQPLDNLGQYWYSKFWANPTVQSLGFVMHTTDLLQPHHTWVTSDLNHAGWESWVKDYYDSEKLNDMALVKQAMSHYSPISTSQSDIRALFTQGGAFSYAQGGSVLHSTDHNVRKGVAKQMIPHAIAMVVHILNHAMTRF